MSSNSSSGQGPLNRAPNAGAAPTTGSANNNSSAAAKGNNASGGQQKSWMSRLGDMGSKVGSFAGDKNTIIAFMVLAFIAIIVIILYIVYKIRNRNLQSVILVEKPLKLFDMQEAPVTFSSDKIVPTSNGQEYTYSFWVYIVDYDSVSSQHRRLFLRNSGSEVDQGNPVVFMDGRTNRMYIAAKTNMASSVNSLDDLLPENNNATKYMTAVVEYVPLQRWVHISVVLQDNLLTVFKDGDMYTVKNVHDLWNSGSGEERPIFMGTRGNVYVGHAQDNNTPTHGFLSRLQFFNYALMEKDVQDVYAQGPTSSGLLSTVGLNQYGVRTPIYKKD